MREWIGRLRRDDVQHSQRISVGFGVPLPNLIRRDRRVEDVQHQQTDEINPDFVHLPRRVIQSLRRVALARRRRGAPRNTRYAPRVVYYRSSSITRVYFEPICLATVHLIFVWRRETSTGTSEARCCFVVQCATPPPPPPKLCSRRAGTSFHLFSLPCASQRLKP